MKHTFRYLVDACVPDATVTLAPEDAHHLARVVRRREGDDVELIDAAGELWPAVVVSVEPAVVRVGPAPRPAPRRLPVSLAVGLAEWGRLDTVVEKATELGVPDITFFASDRADRVPDPAAFTKRLDRMRRVGEAAARQSGHPQMPILIGVASLREVLADVRPTFLIDPRAEVGLTDAVRDAAPPESVVVVGGEAGFSTAEIAAAVEAGAHLGRLGDAILRTETAAIVAVAITAAAMGALGAAEDGSSHLDVAGG